MWLKRSALATTVFGVLLIMGCGGSGSSNGESCDLVVEPRDMLLPYSKNPLYYQQWYSHYDAGFYGKYQCDRNASIHPWPDQNFTGRGVKVAIIDNALDISHEDLKGAIVKVYDVETRTENVCPRSDYENHGTEVTGIVAASSNEKGIVGIAPESSIYFIRMPFGTIRDSVIVEAFEKAKEWGVDVINCSWGSNDVRDSVRNAIVDLATNGRDGNGTIIVFAAGNENQEIGNDEAGIPEVIGVGATNIDNRRTSYSNYGSELDIMAPGGEHLGLTTLDQMGQAGLATKSLNYIEFDDYKDYGNGISVPFGGTSASAPIVTAAVALMLQAEPSLTRQQVYDYLTSNAERFDENNCSYDSNNFSELCGYGKVHVQHTLNAILGI